MGDFLSFRRMIMPVLIQLMFALGSLAAILGGLISFDDNAGRGLVLIVVVPLMLRIICENLIVFFRMNETLTDVDRRLIAIHDVLMQGQRAIGSQHASAAAPRAYAGGPGPTQRRADLSASPPGVVVSNPTSRRDAVQPIGAAAPSVVGWGPPPTASPFDDLVTDPPDAADAARQAYENNKDQPVPIMVDKLVAALGKAVIRCPVVQDTEAYMQEVRCAKSWEAGRTTFARHLLQLQRRYEQSIST